MSVCLRPPSAPRRTFISGASASAADAAGVAQRAAADARDQARRAGEARARGAACMPSLHSYRYLPAAAAAAATWRLASGVGHFVRPVTPPATITGPARCPWRLSSWRRQAGKRSRSRVFFTRSCPAPIVRISRRVLSPPEPSTPPCFAGDLALMGHCCRCDKCPNIAAVLLLVRKLR